MRWGRSSPLGAVSDLGLVTKAFLMQPVFIANSVDAVSRQRYEMLLHAGTVCVAWLIFVLYAMLLTGCSGLGGDGSGSSYAANGPLPDVAPIRAAPSVPLKRRVRPEGVSPQTQSTADVNVWLYVSLASQTHLMKLGADPTTGTRIWEQYLRSNQLPFARVTGPDDLTRISAPGLLILASAVVLSDAEKQAVLEWRNRGGSVLSTWLTATHSPSGESVNFDFMRDVLDVTVVGNTQDEADDTFMIMHGDKPVSHSLQAGTRVWLPRVPSQLPLRLVGQHEAAQIMNWSRSFSMKTPAGLISYNERQMPSGRPSRTVTLGYPEQSWQSANPDQLKAITGEVFAWLRRQPRAYLSAWPFPYQSVSLLALQAAEQLGDSDVAIAKTLSDMGGRSTFYVNSSLVEKDAPLIKKVQGLGHEIAYFGDSFEGFKGQSKTKQTQRMNTMQKQFAAAGIAVPMPASFATPMEAYDDTTQGLLQALKFDNYLAFIEVSESSLPFLVNRADATTEATVVLPRTVVGPEDALDDDPDTGLDNFLAGLELSARMGAMSVVRIPSQSLLLPEQRQRIWEKMSAMREKVWMASAKQIAQWWRNRDRVRVTLEPHPQGYVVSATVARAVEVQEPLSILVNLPHLNSRVLLQALKPGDKLPELRMVDPWRAAITLRAPAAGHYAWLLKFEESAAHEKR